MDITITINTDNSAFEDSRDSEIARILHELADKIESRGINGVNKIRDFNGNQVGSVEVENEDE
jgi:uncharacterized protein (UPF0297 family)